MYQGNYRLLIEDVDCLEDLFIERGLRLIADEQPEPHDEYWVVRDLTLSKDWIMRAFDDGVTDYIFKKVKQLAIPGLTWPKGKILSANDPEIETSENPFIIIKPEMGFLSDASGYGDGITIKDFKEDELRDLIDVFLIVKEKGLDEVYQYKNNLHDILNTVYTLIEFGVNIVVPDDGDNDFNRFIRLLGEYYVCD